MHWDKFLCVLLSSVGAFRMMNPDSPLCAALSSVNLLPSNNEIITDSFALPKVMHLLQLNHILQSPNNFICCGHSKRKGEPKGELSLSSSWESVSHCFLPFSCLFVCRLESTAASGGFKGAEKRCTPLSESSNGQVSNCKNCKIGERILWNYVLFKACFIFTAGKQTCLCNSFSYHNLVLVLTWDCDTRTSGIRLH